MSLRPRQLIYAPHWYDLQALFSKSLGNFSANVQGLARVRSLSLVPVLSSSISNPLRPPPQGMFLLKALYWGRSGLKKKSVSPPHALPPPSPRTIFTKTNLPTSYTIQIRSIINAGYCSIGECPVVIGETGVPFDLNGGEAFRTGDFQWQERQMDAICNALETSLVSFKSVPAPPFFPSLRRLRELS